MMSGFEQKVNDGDVNSVQEIEKQPIQNDSDDKAQVHLSTKSLLSRIGKLALIWKLIIISVPIFLIYFIVFAEAKHSFQVTKASVTVLLRENVLELVTNKVTTMVACTLEDVSENTKAKFIDAAFGKGEGVLIAKVKYIYGIDLEEITEDAVSIEGKIITVTLPEPKLFDLVVDFEREYYNKTPLLRAFYNKIVNEDPQEMMQAAFVDRAREFAQENHLEPSKSEIIARVAVFFNSLFKLGLGNNGFEIVFK